MSTLPNPQSCRGTPSSTVRPGFRLKQTPIDKWSIREKLALASSVHRSGDQNWYSVSRSLKCFGEPNRPADWFSQKNCALQYSELLENVETPKRKRGERGENTAQDLIVLELQQKRIAELKELLVKEKKEYGDLKEELDFIKSGSAPPDKFREVWERMKREEKEKEIAEEEHKKWLIEREAKIAQMKANRHLVLVRSPKSPKSAKSSQVTSPAESDIKAKSETSEKPPEPLTVKIEPPSTDTENSQSNTPQTPTSISQPVPPASQQLPQTPQTPEKTKITPSPVISSPSTSPLLTHLLQSPSPSASGAVPYNILSPSTLKDMQQKTSPSSTHFFPSNITSPTLPRRPMTPLSSSNVTSEQLPSSTIEESKTPVKETPEPAPTPVCGLSSPSAVMSSPTLSKLLETSPTPSVKALTTSLKEAETSEIVSQDIEMTETKESVPEAIDEAHDIPEQLDTNRITKAEPIVETVIESETVEIFKSDETPQLTVHEKSVTTDLNPPCETEPTPPSVSSSIAEVIKSVAESYAQENTVDTNLSSPSEQQLTTEIKQEAIEPKESAEETPMEVDSKSIKIETKTDTENNQPSTPSDSKAPKSSSSSTASRKRKRPPPIVATPPTAPTRRSNRVRTIKDKTSSEDDQVSNTIEEPGSIPSVTTTPAATTTTTTNITTTTTMTTTTTTTTTTITTTPTTSSTTLTTTSTIQTTTSTPTVTVAVSPTVPTVAVVSTPVTSTTISSKKTAVPTPSTLPPPPPLSVSTENSAGEESTDNTNISLPPILIKPPTSAPTTAPTSKASSVTESAPNSPASAILTAEEIENQKEYKMWKKSIMLLWRQAHTHKFSTLFTHPVTDSEAKGYSTVVYRPIDLFSIKKKIESGQLKTTAEFQRDMMLMFQNAIMYNSVDHDVHQMAVEMQKEVLEGIEDYIETQQKSSSPGVNEPTKPRGRRSNVSTSSDAHDPESAEARRRKRVSTDTEPASQSTSSTSKSKTKKKPSN